MFWSYGCLSVVNNSANVTLKVSNDEESNFPYKVTNLLSLTL